MVALDGVPVAAAGFDPVGGDGALDEHLGAGLLGFAFEDTDELLADDLAFLLRLGDTGQGIEVFVGGVDHSEVQTHAFVHGLDLLRLVLAHEARVHVDGVQAVADGLLDDLGGDAGVDASADGDDGVAFAHFLGDLFALFLDELFRIEQHGPHDYGGRRGGTG